MSEDVATLPATWRAAPGARLGPPPGRRLPAWLLPSLLLAMEAAAILGLAEGVRAATGAGPALRTAAWVVAGSHLVLALLPGDPAAAAGGLARPPAAAAFACGLLALLSTPGQALAAILPNLAAWAALGLLAVAGLRRGAAAMAARIPLLRPPRRRVAIVGNGRGAAGILDLLHRAGDDAVEVVGYFDDRTARTGPLTGRLPHLGSVDRLIAFVEDQEISDVYLALPWSAGDRIAGLVDRLRFLPMTVRLVPDEALPAAVEGREAARIVLPVLLRPPLTPAGLRAKAAFDRVAALVIVVLLSPVFLIAPVLIRLDSPGPVFFRQVRIGRFGRRFSILKYRTLHVAQSDAEAETLVTRGDPRVTRVGRFLRKYSVDELPQVLNVLRGEMSLVGPRPHAPRAKADGRLYCDVVPDYLRRYRVCPGLTGWAQVNGYRGETDTEEKLLGRVAYDVAYIRRWSFLLDLWILVRTIPATLAPPAHNR